MNDRSFRRDCKTCDKAITLGYNSEIQKWRPWDDFERRIAHRCRVDSKKVEFAKVDGNNELLDKLDSIKNNQASMLWMLQRIAAKIGVESSGVEWSCLPIETCKAIVMTLIPKVCQLIMRTEGAKPHIDRAYD